MKILVIEDDIALQTALKERFLIEKFEVNVASNGKEGLSKAFEWHPDLITLDVMMPVEDGWSTLEELRANEWGKNVPVMLLTNLTIDDEGLQKVVKEQPSYYFVKSDIQLEEIIAKANELLNIRHE